MAVGSHGFEAVRGLPLANGGLSLTRFNTVELTPFQSQSAYRRASATATTADGSGETVLSGSGFFLRLWPQKREIPKRGELDLSAYHLKSNKSK